MYREPITCKYTDLIHACIGKEKGWVLIGDGGRRRYVCVALGLKVVKKCLANLCCGKGIGM